MSLFRWKSLLQEKRFCEGLALPKCIPASQLYREKDKSKCQGERQQEEPRFLLSPFQILGTYSSWPGGVRWLRCRGARQVNTPALCRRHAQWGDRATVPGNPLPRSCPNTHQLSKGNTSTKAICRLYMSAGTCRQWKEEIEEVTDFLQPLFSARSCSNCWAYKSSSWPHVLMDQKDYF